MPTTSSLTVDGTGSLTATGASNAAGIGGGNGADNGTITIKGGTIDAKGGCTGIGTGCSYSASAKDITINGGTVKATGGSSGAGIGGSGSSSARSITISNSATVLAVESGYSSAIDSASGTAYVLLANFSDVKSSGTTTGVYLKSDSSLKASAAPDVSYQSIAFTLPASGTYQLKTAGKLQKYGSGWSTDISVTTTGLKTLASVADYTAATYAASVLKDDSMWTTGTPELVLSTASGSLTGEISGTCTTGSYSFENLPHGNTYYVWDKTNNQYTGQSVSDSQTFAFVNYYTVTLASGSGIASTSGGGAHLSGSDVNVNAEVLFGSNWSKWTLTADGSTVSAAKSFTITAISSPKSYTANALRKTIDDAYWIGEGNYDEALYVELISTAFSETNVEINTAQELAALARAQDVDGIDFSGVTFELKQDINLSGFLWDPIGISSSDTLHGGADGNDHLFKGNFDGNGRVISNMNIQGLYVSAGLFGNAGDNSSPTPLTINDLTVSGTVETNEAEYVGGFVGSCASLILENCVNNTEITATITDRDFIVGGIAGYGENIVLRDCVNNADISVIYASADYAAACAGGITGAFYGSIYNCANSGSLTLNNTSNQYAFAGGIFGMAEGNPVSNCYNTGAILTGAVNSAAGGICGVNLYDSSSSSQSATVLIKNCYNIGSVSGEFAGGIAGKTDASIYNCFYLTGAAPCAYRDYSNAQMSGSSKTAAEMQASGFCQSLTTWAETNTTSFINYQKWELRTGVNNGYPVFVSDKRAALPITYLPTSDSKTILTIDGLQYSIGSESKNGASTTSTVDQTKFADGLTKAANGSSTVFPVSANTDVTARLVVKNIEDMAQKNMTLAVQTGRITYNLKTAAVDTAEIREALGTADAQKVPFDVKISNSSAAVNGAALVVSPVEFSITCTYNGKTVSVDTFSSFVSRSVEVTAEQAKQITTAVVVASDGSSRHVPTKITVVDSKYYAVLNSLTNSTYALIYHPVEFTDAASSWAKSAINDMASRLVVSGVGNGKYEPERNITRAEFAAIMVRALGLAPQTGTAAFSDVSVGDWYCGYIDTAVSYGLILGYGDGNFGTNDNITREQAMAFIARAMTITKLSPDLTQSQLDKLLAGYSDSKEASTWALKAVAACLSTGVVNGRTSTALCPKDNITRAEVAVIVQRLLQKSGLI